MGMIEFQKCITIIFNHLNQQQFLLQEQLSYMKKNPKKIAHLHQFKNAYHFAINNNKRSEHLFNLDTKNRRTISQGLLKNYRTINDVTSRQQNIDNFGITITDEGDIIIAEWAANKVQGNYFIFKTFHYAQQKHRNLNSGFCYYGQMQKGYLQRDNYVYNISGTLSKATFHSNNYINPPFIIYNNKFFINSRVQKSDKIECQTLILSQKQKTNASDKSNSHKAFNKLKAQSHLCKNVPTIKLQNESQFKKPLIFLQQLIQKHSKKQEQYYLAMNQINQHQIFFGYVHHNPIQKQQTVKLQTFNGFGVIFKDGWPFKYGQFQDGKLSGVGRVYQTQMNICDGIFQKDHMVEGFLIDNYNHKIQYGTIEENTSNSISYSSNSKNKFTVKMQSKSSEFHKIIEFKKAIHLKSLNFNNNYFNEPQIIKNDPWPSAVIEKLMSNKRLPQILRSFNNEPFHDVDVSSIDKNYEMSQNIIELDLIKNLKIKEPNDVYKIQSDRKSLMNQKSQIIKKQIEKNLNSKSNPKLAKEVVISQQKVGQEAPKHEEINIPIQNVKKKQNPLSSNIGKIYKSKAQNLRNKLVKELTKTYVEQNTFHSIQTAKNQKFNYKLFLSNKQTNLDNKPYLKQTQNKNQPNSTQISPVNTDRLERMPLKNAQLTYFSGRASKETKDINLASSRPTTMRKYSQTTRRQQRPNKSQKDRRFQQLIQEYNKCQLQKMKSLQMSSRGQLQHQQSQFNKEFVKLTRSQTQSGFKVKNSPKYEGKIYHQ